MPHDTLTGKLLALERILLENDYQELVVRTKATQLKEKVHRIIHLKEEQIQLLEDLLKEMHQFTFNGHPIDGPESG